MLDSLNKGSNSDYALSSAGASLLRTGKEIILNEQHQERRLIGERL